MKLQKLLCLVLTLVLSFASLSGCTSNENYVIYMELNEAPDTLDPQLANGLSEELLVKNLFEGLMRQDAEGNVTYGAAKSHTVSGDGLTYTFTLADDKKWQNGDPVTAADFVYGLTRAVDPAIAAPYASSLYSIVGAEEIHTGLQTDGLGITAPNATTLLIRLKSPDPEILKTLTTAIAMPCHKKTFEKAKGQYGKTGDHLLCNGSYRLRYWNKEETFSLRINQNEAYTGTFTGEATAVIFSAGELSGRAARIDEENLDMGFVDRSEATDQSNLFTFEKTCYALVINPTSAFGSADFRKAFALSVHRNRLQNELGLSFAESGCLLPGSITQNGKSLNSQCTVTVPPAYDPDAAHELYIAAAKASSNLPAATEILYYGNAEVTQLAKLVAEGFQQALGAVVNLRTAESESALHAAIQSKNYQLAILPITAQSNDPAQFLSQFSTTAGDRNICGFASPKYDAEIDRITPTADAATVISATENALRLLISDLSVIPLALYTEAFAYGKAFSCPTISPFGGVVDLALVKKIA